MAKLASQKQIREGQKYGFDFRNTDRAEASRILRLHWGGTHLKRFQEEINRKGIQIGCSVHYRSGQEERDGIVQNIIQAEGLVTVRWDKPIGENQSMVSVVTPSRLVVTLFPD